MYKQDDLHVKLCLVAKKTEEKKKNGKLESHILFPKLIVSEIAKKLNKTDPTTCIA